MLGATTINPSLPESGMAALAQPASRDANQRATERYRTMGTATLTCSGRVLQGRIYDLSMNGLSLMVEHMPNSKISPRMNWLCSVDSKDLPCPIDFVARVVRQRKWGNGAELGCEIVLIDHQPLRVLSAFRALARLRKRHA